MSEPLIDRYALRIAIHDVVYQRAHRSGTVAEISDAVLAYLRSVLTPEALDDLGPGIDLHRRIFGEDKSGNI